jgi:hypothetical protein
MEIETMKPQISMNRRAMLGRLAAAGAVVAALPVTTDAAPAADGTFVAIERHRAANAAFTASLNAVDEVWARQNGYTTTQADRDAYEAATESERQSLDDLVATIPTTIAGVGAVLAYLNQLDGGYYLKDAVPTILTSPVFSAEGRETA